MVKANPRRQRRKGRKQEERRLVRGKKPKEIPWGRRRKERSQQTTIGIKSLKKMQKLQ